MCFSFLFRFDCARVRKSFNIGVSRALIASSFVGNLAVHAFPSKIAAGGKGLQEKRDFRGTGFQFMVSGREMSACEETHKKLRRWSLDERFRHVKSTINILTDERLGRKNMNPRHPLDTASIYIYIEHFTTSVNCTILIVRSCNPTNKLSLWHPLAWSSCLAGEASGFAV